MCMIFDRFKTRKQARDYAKAIKRYHGLEAKVYLNQEESNKDDPFPFELTPPIVLIERSTMGREIQARRLAVMYDGQFAGT